MNGEGRMATPAISSGLVKGVSSYCHNFPSKSCDPSMAYHDCPTLQKIVYLIRKASKSIVILQVRRYVRFPGQPWDLAPIAPIAPLTPVAPRSPRLVFRDSVTPDLQTPAQLPVWTQNSLVPPEEPQQ
ncbi:unnamed protein product, partial [Nesidiocoris tenuis]